MEAYNGKSLKKESKFEEQEASDENASHWQRHQKSTTWWSCNKTGWYVIEIDGDRNVIVKPQASVMRGEVYYNTEGGQSPLRHFMFSAMVEGNDLGQIFRLEGNCL